MKRREWLCAIGILVLLLVGVVMVVPFLGLHCEKGSPYAQTQHLLNQILSLLWQVWQEDGESFLATPSYARGSPNMLNSHCAYIMVEDKRLLDRQWLEDDGFLSEGGDLLLDTWGRPLVFQAPSMYPKGLTCLTAHGPRKIAPLSDSLWNRELFGPVQVWSLGPNGVDDRGRGDDFLPNRVRTGSPFGTPIGPLPPSSEPR